MTQAEHTQELYDRKLFGQELSRDDVWLIVMRGIIAGITDSTTDQFSDTEKANFDRVVLCVNACRGLNPEAIQAAIEACKNLQEFSTSVEAQLPQDRVGYCDSWDKFNVAYAAVKAT